MFYYKIFNLNILSKIELPAKPNKKGPVDVSILFDDYNESIAGKLSKGRQNWQEGDSYYFYYSNLGLFHIRGGREIILSPQPDLETNRLIQLVLGTLFAALLQQRGFIVFHASAINMDGKAVAFMGPSRVGKSTLAQAMHRLGFPVITDDILPLKLEEGVPLVTPGLPYLKLSPKLDHGGQKSGVIFHKEIIHFKNGVSQEPLPLKYIYALEPNHELTIQPFNSQEAFMGLVWNSFFAPLLSSSEKAINFKRCAEITKHVQVKSLKINHSLNAITKTAYLVQEDVIGRG